MQNIRDLMKVLDVPMDDMKWMWTSSSREDTHTQVMASSDSELVEMVGINEGQSLMLHHACLARRQWTMVATNIVDKQEKTTHGGIKSLWSLLIGYFNNMDG